MRPRLVSRSVAGVVRSVILLAAVSCGNSLAQNIAPPPDAQKKISDLEKAVKSGSVALDSARRDTAELFSLTDPNSDKGNFLSRLQPINGKLKDIAVAKLLDQLTTKHITDAKANLPSCDVTTLVDANLVTRCTKSSTDADELVAALPDALSDLTAQLKAIVPYFDATLNKASAELNQLSTSWSSPNSLSAEDFATGAATYGRNCSVSQGIEKPKGDAYGWLKKLNIDTKSDPEVDTLAQLNRKLVENAKPIDPILTNIRASVDDRAKKASDSITAVAATPIASAQTASDAATEARKAVRGAATALNTWSQLDKDLQKCAKDASLAKLREDIKAIQIAKSTLQEKLSLLNDALVGDPNQFTEDAVPLFFYTEVEKLMRSLNERTDSAGGSSTASTVAASQRELLLDAESRVSQARGEVADLQFELAKLQEEQRKADAASSVLGIFKQKADLTKKNSDSDLVRATDDYNRAQAESDADPSNAEKKAQLQKAKERNDTATRKAADAATKQSDADTKVKDAEAQQTAANGDKDSLKARIDLATSKLGDAQRNMEEMQRSAYRAALTDSDAFAAARDQTPYLEAPALSTSPDPVKRVILRGYPDRNLILLRGKPEDIAVVKRLIAAFDVPAPQARLTLWSFEISREVSKGFLWFNKPADDLNKATAIVDDNLGKTRGQIADAKTALRAAVNEAVSSAETGGVGASSTCTVLDMPPEMYKLTLSEQARWRRFRFYSPAVLVQAGVNLWDTESFRAAVLPDPAATTTVGEAMMVLALSCGKNRKSVYEKFQNQTGKCFKGTAQVVQVKGACPAEKNTAAQVDSLDERERQLDERARSLQEEKINTDRDRSVATNDCTAELQNCKSALKDALKLSQSSSCPDPTVDPERVTKLKDPTPLAIPEGITDMQLEIVRALRAGATKKVLQDLQRLRDQIGKLEKDYKDFRTERSRAGLTDSDASACGVRVSEIDSLYNRYNRIVNTRFRILYPNEYTDFQLIPDRRDFIVHVQLRSAEAWQKIAEAGPRVAAADEMLKGMMTRLEDDLDSEYIQVMLKKVRKELVTQGLTVGIVQRTSVLATNRLKARVDPKGMYDLSVGEQQDLLASIGQLASIYLSAQTGGVLSAFGTLNSLNQKQEQRIYGVTTGNKFEVTPIFDPSGQALRFKFDYVSNSLIRNPKGSVDPTMPSLRHTINTEVQLSNLEIREISRYESNAKLGIPTRYYGGIPILTDIPGLKPIPLIGWFVRRAGSNAEVQQSVIFGQTTIYPTIGSIVDLLQTGN